MKNRAIAILAICVMAIFQGCGPVPVYLNIESKSETGFVMPLSGRNPAVVSFAGASQRDSTLVSEMAIGIAEGIESESGLDAGVVGVYSVPSEGDDLLRNGSLDILALQTGRDIFVVVDSLRMAGYQLVREMENVVDVLLPLGFELAVYDAGTLSTLHSINVADTVTWRLVGDDFIPNSTAISYTNNHLKPGFREFGAEVAKLFLPRWNQEERTLICYSGSRWENAYYLALDFKWEQAMEIWLELVKSTHPQKSGCAAYNLAVACEILGKDDTARKWLAYAESKCYFPQMTTLKKMLD